MPTTAVPDPERGSRGEWLRRYRFAPRYSEQGHVESIGDGIAWVSGLPSAAMQEVIRLDGGGRALVFHLGRQSLGAVLLEQSAGLGAGAVATLAGERLRMPVGDALLGRVVDPLGRPLDGGAAPRCDSRRDLDVLSPPLTERDFVNSPLYTGVKVVDALIPIAKGQRQLVIGDNGVGKTALALDAVVNQKDSGVRCVYVLVGQKRSSVIAVIETLRAAGAMAYTTVIAAGATDLPGLKYLAPFAGCALAEEWMAHGLDTLVVYDDLTTHARVYRELSLLMRRPPGREAYPGDIFYLHARLLERATHLSAARGGGSMTALPIVETEQGEIAAYIPTNLISITDGQIYMDQRLFAAGVLPAVDVTRSVSRIGGKAQVEPIKREAGRTKLDYLQFLELEIFTRFGARLEASMEARVRHGRALREILKQERLAPLPIEAQMAWLVAFNDGLLDALEPEAVAAAVARLAAGVAEEGLALAAGREQWARSVRLWLGDTGAGP